MEKEGSCMRSRATWQKLGWGVAMVLGLAVGTPVWADVLELKTGETVEGRLLAVGPTRLVFDGPEGHVYASLSDVARVLDDAGAVLDTSQVAGEDGDPVGVVRTVEGAIRIRREGRDLKVSIHGSLSILREGDELRTGPYGRVSFQVPGGGQASARSDAILRFREGAVALVEGKLRLRHGGGRDTLAFVPEGRVRLVEGQTELEHLRGRTRLVCLTGRTVFVATQGYRVEVPRKHVLDVRSQVGHEPACVSASNTNAWPLRLEYGAQWVSIQPGERVVLLGTPGPAAPPGPTAPPPVVVARETPAESPATPGMASVLAGRIVRATGSFGLQRGDHEPRRVDQAEARGLEISSGDHLVTDSGEIFAEFGESRVTILASSELRLRSAGAGGPLLRLVAGEASLQSQGQATLGIADGAVGLLRGEASVRQSGKDVQVVLRTGTAGARFGTDVRAELIAPAELLARRDAAKISMTVPPAAQSVPVTLGMLDLQLAGGKAASYARTGERRTIVLWNGSTLEFMDAIRARVVSGPSESWVLELEDDSRVPLQKGTYRFERRGKEIVKHLPGGAEPEAEPVAPPEVLAKKEAPSGKRQVLSNGAIVLTRAWGELEIKRKTGEFVVVAGPGGDLWLGPRTESTLSRERGVAQLETSDGRFVRCAEGAGPVDVRYEKNGHLRMELYKASARRRVIEVEARTEFDVTVRRDRYVLAFVFGQAVYLEPGQHMSVSQASGLRTYMAAERTGK
jgi:hypothetical protein